MYKNTRSIAELQKFLDDHGIKHFSAKEITWLPRLQKHVVPPPDLWGNIIPTLQLADAIRDEWGDPVNVLSGYRTQAYNAAVGGAPNSQHMHFRALDLNPKNGKLVPFFDCVAGVVERWRAEGNQVGLGVYRSFNHVDVGYKTRSWHG